MKPDALQMMGLSSPMQSDLFESRVITRKSAREARERGHAMADLAEARNERDNPGWTDAAIGRLRSFARSQAGVFTVEMARGVIEHDLPPPTDARIWGKVTVLARKLGVIEPVRGQFFPAASSNGAVRQVYRRGSKA